MSSDPNIGKFTLLVKKALKTLPGGNPTEGALRQALAKDPEYAAVSYLYTGMRPDVERWMSLREMHRPADGYQATPKEEAHYSAGFIREMRALASRHDVTILCLVGNSYLEYSDKEKAAEFAQKKEKYGSSDGMCESISCSWLDCQIRNDDEQWAKMNDPDNLYEMFGFRQHANVMAATTGQRRVARLKSETDEQAKAAQAFKDKATGGMFVGLQRAAEHAVGRTAPWSDAQNASFVQKVNDINCDTLRKLVPAASAASYSQPKKGTPDQILKELKPGYYLLKITGKAMHALACKKFQNTTTLVDPNGCVWYGQTDDVGDLVTAFYRESGIESWYTQGSWNVVEYNRPDLAPAGDILGDALGDALGGNAGLVDLVSSYL